MKRPWSKYVSSLRELVAKTAVKKIKTGRCLSMSLVLTKLEYARLGRSKSQNHILLTTGGIEIPDQVSFVFCFPPMVEQNKVQADILHGDKDAMA